MASLPEHVARKLADHARRFASLPLKAVPTVPLPDDHPDHTSRPQNVRVVRPDGRVVPVELTPSCVDGDGVQVWVCDMRLGRGDELHVGFMPARSAIEFRVAPGTQPKLVEQPWWRRVLSRVTPVVWLLLAVLIIGASIGFSARANATPASDYASVNASRVCATLDKFPSVAGVEGVVLAIVKETGQDGYFAGEVIAESVINVCPRHLGLLRQFADKWGPRTEVISGAVGGRLI